MDCVRLVSIDLGFGYLDFFHLIFVFKTVLVYCVANVDYLDLPKLQTAVGILDALQLPMIKTSIPLSKSIQKIRTRNRGKVLFSFILSDESLEDQQKTLFSVRLFLRVHLL